MAATKGNIDLPATLVMRLLVALNKTQTSAITRSSQTATFTSTAHGYSNGDVVTISGATQAAYNGTFVIANVAADTFDFTVVGSPTTPSTGTASATILGAGITSGAYLANLKLVGDRVSGEWICP